MDRWNLLKPREKEIVWRYVVLSEKRYTVGRNLGISRTRITELLVPVYRVLGIRDVVELALFVGRNYEQIELDAIAFGFVMPKLEVDIPQTAIRLLSKQ
jgi:hypothetical protein